ncbi:hypothetical protein Moror_9340, partial [Moniliophthora roreri MCA 2997]
CDPTATSPLLFPSPHHLFPTIPLLSLLVVAPGFHWEDHEFVTKEGLAELFQGVEGGEEKIAEFQTYLK